MLVKFGAQGIGLCRTEHMFFDAEQNSKAFRRYDLSLTTEEAREIALRSDYFLIRRETLKSYMRLWKEDPVTIRFLDPPLHEFLPQTDGRDYRLLPKHMGSYSRRRSICYDVQALHEFNPMMGHRGCRLAVTYPEIAKMQTRAVIGSSDRS